MLPVISFAVGDKFIALSAYSTMFYLAALVTLGVSFAFAVHRGLPSARVVVVLLLMTVAVPVGARLWHTAINIDLYLKEPERLFSLDFGGFSLYGGLILAITLGLISSRLLALDVVRLADAVAPGLGLGIAIMRTGCLMAGCCFGQETDLPWGIVFPSGSNAHLYQITHGLLFFAKEPLPVHPTQLIELSGGLLSAAVACFFLYRGTVDGTAFLSAAMLFSMFRWLDYYLRALPSTLTVPDWFYPVLYLGIIVTCAWLIARRYLLRKPSVADSPKPGHS